MSHTESLARLVIYAGHVEGGLINFRRGLKILIAVKPHMKAAVINFEKLENVIRTLVPCVIQPAFDPMGTGATEERCEKAHKNDQSCFHVYAERQDERWRRTRDARTWKPAPTAAIRPTEKLECVRIIGPFPNP
jgi:hypothetical protein